MNKISFNKKMNNHNFSWDYVFFFCKIFFIKIYNVIWKKYDYVSGHK